MPCGMRQRAMTSVLAFLPKLRRNRRLDTRPPRRMTWLEKNPRAQREQFTDSLRLLMLALILIVVFHGGLLPFTHENTYDAFIHMFFGEHYHRSWFDPWEPRWYTGFATTSYPPGTHMAQGLLLHIVPLRAAFCLVFLTGLLMLCVGVYRFSRLWVSDRAAGYAAVLLALSSSVSETVHLFGQLPTIVSLGIFLNGTPYVFRWIAYGGWAQFLSAVVFASATTAAHHVTTLFGGVLFILPLSLHALNAAVRYHPSVPRGVLPVLRCLLRPVGRGLLLGVFMLAAIVVTVMPYWIWSVSDPITQVPIPHGSRENFLVRRDLGFVFFVIPWGLLILILPYVVYKGLTTVLWPLAFCVILTFVLGTGGTTPISRAILRGAFDILTLDRFTFWSTMLCLPFAGLFIDSLLQGRLHYAVRRAIGSLVYRMIAGGLFASFVLVALVPALLPRVQPTQPDFIDPVPIVKFLESDNHDHWRYLTLGFGDQFAYLAAQTDAQSVDGNYHSARRLPDLTRFSVERLENAKYSGIPGLGSLNEFLVDAEKYHLKYVFSNDEFYDPLLYFSGWERLNRLQNGIVVWEKPDISPLPRVLPRNAIPPAHAIMWGLVPPTAIGLMIFTVLLWAVAGPPQYRRLNATPTRSVIKRRGILIVRAGVLTGLAIFVGIGVYVGSLVRAELNRIPGPEEVLETYYEHLDFRRYEEAYALLEPDSRGTYEEVALGWRWVGGLVRSYGKLDELELERLQGTADIIDWRVTASLITSLRRVEEVTDMRTVRRDGRWYVVQPEIRPLQNPERVASVPSVQWNLAGRRQAKLETDVHRDKLDRPSFVLHGMRLVQRDKRFHIVGQVMNADVDPMHLSVFADIREGGQTLETNAAGQGHMHRLLPAESAGIRVDFFGQLPLEGAEGLTTFDPTLYIPPKIDEPPDNFALRMRAVVSGAPQSRNISLNTVTWEETDKGLRLRGMATNGGLNTASVVQINVLLFDTAGAPIWVETVYLDANIYPGHASAFDVILPHRDGITVLAEMDIEQTVVNGVGASPGDVLETPVGQIISLNGAGGYGAMQLVTQTMDHDALF